MGSLNTTTIVEKLPAQLKREGSFVPPKDLEDRDRPDVLFRRSYLLTRMVVGIVAIALPIIFIVGEAFLSGSLLVRGSLSAYYHSSMRDIFVGGLCVIGFMLITYMSGQHERTDFKLSLISGIAVLGVAFIPTERPGLAEDAARCGTDPAPAGCSPVQQVLHEELAATLHFVCAAVFILSLAAACLYFAYQELCREHSKRMANLQIICAGAIVVAMIWIAVGGALGLTVWVLKPLYLGEIVSEVAFAISWLARSRDLWTRTTDKVVEAAQRQDG